VGSKYIWCEPDTLQEWFWTNLGSPRSTPRASTREDLRRNCCSAGSRAKKCVVRRSIGSKGRHFHWCRERELSSPTRSMVLPGKR